MHKKPSTCPARFSTPIGRYRTCGTFDVELISILSAYPPRIVVAAWIKGVMPYLGGVDSWYELIIREGVTTGSRVVCLRNAELVHHPEKLVVVVEEIIYDERLPIHFDVGD